MRLVPVGRIIACHGVRGLVRVRCFNSPPSPQMLETPELHVQNPDGSTRCWEVESLQPHGTRMLLKLAGIESRTRAQELVGCTISLSEDALPPLGPDEFYYYEIVGFRVHTTAGAVIGVIDQVFDTGSNDVWVVRAGPREHLIPVIKDVVKHIDRQGRRVIIEPLQGLLDEGPPED